MPRFYKQIIEQVTLQKYVRCHAINITNSLDGATVNFMEQEVTEKDGDVVELKGVGGISMEFDPDALIELRDPANGEKTGATMPQGLIYMALYSAYMAEAEKRDTAPPAEQEVKTIQSEMERAARELAAQREQPNP
jgi:hypothetical protein